MRNRSVARGHSNYIIHLALETPWSLRGKMEMDTHTPRPFEGF
jgi:hypothetical protein